VEDCRDPLLIVDGLSVTFDRPRGAVAAVRDVGFTLGRERLGIVGESGSGKSQTGRALLGLLARNGRMSARQHSFDGVDLLRAGEAERGLRPLVRPGGRHGGGGHVRAQRIR